MTTPAWAKSPPRARATLRTEISSKANTCVSPEELRERISARLGYDPFTADAARQVRIQIEVERAGFRGRVETIDAQGRTRQRKLRSAQCQDLVDAVVLTSSLAIDPVRSMRPAPPPGAMAVTIAKTRLARARARAQGAARLAADQRFQIATASARAYLHSALARAKDARLPKTPPVTPTPSAEEDRSWHLVGATATRLGDMPRLAQDLGLGLELVPSGPWRAQVVLRSTLPHIYPTVWGGEVTLSSQRIDLSGCRLLGPAALCAAMTVGTFTGVGRGFAQDTSALGALAGVGARATWDAVTWDALTLRLTLECWQMLTSARWQIDDVSLHETPWQTAAAGLQVLWRL